MEVECVNCSKLIGIVIEDSGGGIMPSIECLDCNEHNLWRRVDSARRDARHNLPA